MTDRSPHILMSVTESMLGLLAAVPSAQGALDVARLAVDYVPELRDTAWGGRKGRVAARSRSLRRLGHPTKSARCFAWRSVG